MRAMLNARTVVVVLLVVAASLALVSIGSTVTYQVIADEENIRIGESDLDRISADSVLVMIHDSEEVLVERNADKRYPIASITKLFTAHIANTSGKLDTDVLIVWQDYSVEGTAGGLRLGQTYTIRELLFPLLLSSSNDAAEAIRRGMDPSTYAQGLETLFLDAELTQTTIVDPSGLAVANSSTARDLSRFIAYLEAADPHVLDITALQSYMGPYGGWINNSPARAHASFRGGKHGNTDEAKRTFVGIFTTEAASYRVILLGSDDLAADIAHIVKRLQ